MYYFYQRRNDLHESNACYFKELRPLLFFSYLGTNIEDLIHPTALLAPPFRHAVSTLLSSSSMRIVDPSGKPAVEEEEESPPHGRDADTNETKATPRGGLALVRHSTADGETAKRNNRPSPQNSRNQPTSIMKPTNKKDANTPAAAEPVKMRPSDQLPPLRPFVSNNDDNHRQ